LDCLLMILVSVALSIVLTELLATRGYDGSVLLQLGR
jgi:hypothetical protein